MRSAPDEDSKTLELSHRVTELQKAVFGSHQCDKVLAYRVRTVAGGATHIVPQCQTCGQQRGGPLSKARAAEKLGPSPAPAFDEDLQRRYSDARRQLHDEWTAVSRALKERTDPESLRRAEIAQQESASRALALSAAQGKVRAALDVAMQEAEPIAWNHRLGFIIGHLQEAHGASLRDPDAKPVHQFGSEQELREWLDTWLEEDFEVLREVPGRHLTEGTRVKVDYFLSPREHLVSRGFRAGPIGLEVKHLPVHGGFSPKASRFVWQAVSYTECEFEVGALRIRLPTMLLFSNVSFDEELAMLRGIDHSALGNDRAKWTALLELANHANVGNLEIYGARGRREGWRIAFATGVYFRRRGAEYSLSDANLFNKVRIGNF